MRNKGKIAALIAAAVMMIIVAVSLAACGETETETFTVTLKSGFDDGLQDSYEVAAGATFVLPENMFERNDYVFVGWSREGSTFVLSPGAAIPIYADAVYIANWKTETGGEPSDDPVDTEPDAPGTVTVTLFAGYGSETIAVVVERGGEYTLPESAFTREGFTFAGWSTDDGILEPGAKITINSSVTITAIWTEAYRLTFVDGTDIVYEFSDLERGEFVISPGAPVREGYEFMGWQAEDGTLIDAGANYNVNGSMTFEAAWEKQTFVITFIIRSDTREVTVEYGATPVCPADVPESVNVNNTTMAVFTGWDREIVPATENATYTAVYAESARLYPVTFVSCGYVYFVVNGERVTECSTEYNRAVSFTLERGPGVFIDSVTVTGSSGVLTPSENGVYTLPFSASSMTVEVSGFELAEYDISFRQFNVEYVVTHMPDTVNYGDVISFKARGFEGYGELAPEVEYNQETISPISSEPDADGYYSYEVTAVCTADITVTGKETPIIITYIDYYGDEWKVEWTSDMGAIGDARHFPEDFPCEIYSGSDAYFASAELWNYVFDDEGEWVSTEYCYPVNAAPYGENNIVGNKDDYDYWSTYCYEAFSSLPGYIYGSPIYYDPYGNGYGELLANIPYPQRGEDNVYYVLYSPVYSVECSIATLAGTTDIAWLKEGEGVWYDYTLDSFSEESGYAGMVWLYEKETNEAYFYENEVIYIKMTLPAGVTELPVLFNIYDPEKKAEIGTWDITLSDDTVETVYGYRIVVDTRDEIYYLEDESLDPYVYNASVTLDGSEPFDLLALYAGSIYRGGGAFPSRNVLLQSGKDLGFRLQIRTSSPPVDIDSLIQAEDDGTYTLLTKDLFTVDGIYGSIAFAATKSSGYYYIDVVISGIESDITIRDFTLPRTTFYVPLLLSDEYDYYVSGVKVEGEAGSIVTAPLYNGTSIEMRIKEGAEGTFIKAGKNNYGTLTIGTTYQYNASSGSTATRTGTGTLSEDGRSVSYSFNLSTTNITRGYGNFVQDSPFMFTSFGIGYNAENVADKCLSQSAFSAITYEGASTPLPFVTAGGVFEVKVNAPLGTEPVLNVEQKDIPSDGFRQYRFLERVESGTAGIYTYTFRVSVAGEVRWYITGVNEVYDITLVYGNGKEDEVLRIEHGTDLEAFNIEYVGVNESGVETLYMVAAWKGVDAAGAEFTALIVDGTSMTLTAVSVACTHSARFIGESGEVTYYENLAAALTGVKGSTGRIEMLYGHEDASLASGSWYIPQGIELYLPYETGGYGRVYGETSNASTFYATPDLGTVSVVIGAGAELEISGKVSVGGIVGYPKSAEPYQGQTAGSYAVLKADGKVTVVEGGVLDINGYVEGAGSLELKSGAHVSMPFVVKDYRGGSNSFNVYSAGYAPFNIYEMPNILVPNTIHYGATVSAYAMLFASGAFNEAVVEVVGDEGIIRVNEGGRVEALTRRIDNPRYSSATSSYEPPYEYRTAIDVYGGGTDGVMSLVIDGAIRISTKDVNLGIPYTFERITLRDGEYTLYNKYKILPGATFGIAEGATLNLVQAELDGAAYQSSVMVYGSDFAESRDGQLKGLDRRLVYPEYPNYLDGGTTKEAGVFELNGTLKIGVGVSFAGLITTSTAGATIEVRTLQANLTMVAREVVRLSGQPAIEYTYQANLIAMAGEIALQSGRVYKSSAAGDGFAWAQA